MCIAICVASFNLVEGHSYTSDAQQRSFQANHLVKLENSVQDVLTQVSLPAAESHCTHTHTHTQSHCFPV